MLTAAQKQLLHLLKQYSPFDEEEARLHHYALTFVELEPIVFDPRVLPAHITGSALVVDPNGPRVLLQEDGGIWRLPGGHDEGEQDAARTAQRYAEAASGLKLRFHLPLRIFDLDSQDVPATDTQRAHRHIEVTFQMHPTDARVEGRPGVSWVPIRELPLKMTGTRGWRLRAKLEGT